MSIPCVYKIVEGMQHSTEQAAVCHQGFPEKAMNKLEDFGFIQSRPRGEYHANNQQMSKLLHKAVGLGNKGAAPQEAYAAYQQHFKDSPVCCRASCWLPFKTSFVYCTCNVLKLK